MHQALADPALIHAALWRGDQISRYQGVTISSGVAELDAELPGNGSPRGALIDVLLQNIGIGEMRLPSSARNRPRAPYGRRNRSFRAGTCGALLYWQDRIRNEHLRRLHLAASATTTLFFVLQPIYSQGQASPAALRVVLRPALDGVEVEFVKRRGPPRDGRLFVPVGPSPILFAEGAEPVEAPRHREPSALVVPVLSSI